MKKSWDKVCLVCYTPFRVYASKPHIQTCSRKCAAKIRRKAVEKECPTCGVTFYARLSQLKKGYANYCSKQCWADTLKKRKTFSCLICKRPFERAPWQIKKGWNTTCSKPCTSKYLRRMSTHGGGRVGLFTIWQKREWKEDKCVACGSTEDLQLDHIVPRFAGGSTTRHNSQTLCRKCNLDKYWSQDMPYYIWLWERRLFNRTLINRL